MHRRHFLQWLGATVVGLSASTSTLPSYAPTADISAPVNATPVPPPALSPPSNPTLPPVPTAVAAQAVTADSQRDKTTSAVICLPIVVAQAVTAAFQRVIVIGAGMAGLAAAQRLSQRGIKPLVLEARDRIGGRLWTSNKWPDAPMDLGASWIHGVDGNPIMTLAQTVGAKMATTYYESTIGYGSQGQVLSDAQEAQIERLDKAITQALKAAQKRDDDQSIQTVIEKALNWAKLSLEEQQLVSFILNGKFEQEYAGSIGELSAHWYDDDAAFKGDDALFLAGYGAIAGYLAQGLDIKTNSPVRQIEWKTAKDRVSVTTDSATYVAEKVLVTLPLGVLKRSAVMFKPALPAQKQKAIEALKMGVLNKCYLRFPKVFWQAKYDWMEYVAPNAGEWVEWVSFARPTGLPILLGFNAANIGQSIEALSDEKIVASAMQTLRTIFGRNTPDPIDYQITRWSSDPFAGGSYSFNPVGAVPEMRDHLAKSLDDVLYFAGEAASRQYFGTVHGAYLSGVKAADEILKTA
ncbi:MAG: NAD(P)/FAD-dependent oxidoreductase [Chloroflexota bacterium]|nr:FAD-dependent oxidoreductase [Chloroflexota bacterium]